MEGKNNFVSKAIFPAVHVGSTALAKNFSCESGVLFFIAVVDKCSFKAAMKEGDVCIVWRLANSEEKDGAHPTLSKGEAVIRDRKVFRFMTDEDVADILEMSVKGYMIRIRFRLIIDDLERIMGAFMAPAKKKEKLVVKIKKLPSKVKGLITPAKQPS